MLDVDPTHALLLAAEAYRRDSLEISHREVRRAMDMMFEVDRQRVPFQNFLGGSGFITSSAIHPTKPWIAYCDRFDNLWFRDHSTGQSKKIIEGPITESDKEVANDHVHSLKVAYDAAGENLFVTRMGAETIEVCSADASEVRCELAVSGQTLRLLGQCATRALTAGWGKEDQIFRELRLWDVADGSLISKVEPKDSLLRWARLSPDRARVAIGLTSTITGAARVEVWNMEQGQQVVQLGGNLGPSIISSDGRWSPSGDRFFTCSRKSAADDTEAALSGATLWSLPGGEVVAELVHEDPCVDGAFSADGSTLATVCSDSGVIRLWDGRTGEWRCELEGHEDRSITSLDYSMASPHLLATTCYDQTARIWDVNTGASVAVFLGMANRLSYGGGAWIGERYMSLTEKGMLHQWSTGQQPWPRKVSVEAGEVQAAWFAESGQSLVLRSDAGVMSVRDWRTGERLVSHAWAAILADDMLVDDVRGAVTALTSGGASVVEWNWRTDVERTLSYAGPPLESIRPYAKGDARCLLENGSGDLEVWDFDLDEQLYVIHPSDQEARWLITASCSTRDLLATGAADGYLRIWSAATGALVRELGPFHPHNGDAQISGIVFSSDGMSVYAISRDARLRGWNVDSGEPTVERATHTAGHLAWVGEDHLLASAAYRGMLTIFESHGGMATRTQIALGVQPGTFISVSKDGKHILYGDAKSAVQLLDASWLIASSKEKVGRQAKERARVGSFSINPHLVDQPGHFHAAVFSPDDQFILTVGDGKAWIWPADLLSAAQEVMPVSAEFFGALPSPSVDWVPAK
jgi:WD40 repeat protein